MRSLHHFTYHDATGEDLGRTGNTDPTMIPSGIFKTRDGKFLALAIASDKQFQSFCKALGRDDLARDEKYKKAISRLKPEHALTLNKIVEEWVKTKDADGLIELARKHRFAVSEVMDDVQISQDEWRRERGSVIPFEDDMYKKLVIEGPIAMLSKTPGRTKWLTRPLGYHNRYVLKKIMGLTEDQIKELEKERVVGNWDYRVGQRPPIYHDLAKDKIFNYEGGEDH
jgi:CoA:oxalate CoA-transferase